MRLESKVALVTGDASGNGKAIAKLYAKEGAKIVDVDLDEDCVQATVCEITSEHGTAIAVQADVTKENDVQRIVDKAVSQFGTLDILVNNAGIFDMLLPAGYVSDELWNKVIDINLTAPMQTIRKALPILEKQACRVIVNMMYIAEMFAAHDGGAAYVASKYGIIGLAKNVAFNYMRRNIRTNAVAPDRVNTNLRANSQRIAGVQDKYDKTISQWKDVEAAVKDGDVTDLRIAEPEEIARVLCF